jgi:hypothetical protein
MAIKYNNIPLQVHPEFTQIGISGLKMCHLATLLGSIFLRKCSFRSTFCCSAPISISRHFDSKRAWTRFPGKGKSAADAKQVNTPPNLIVVERSSTKDCSCHPPPKFGNKCQD